MSGAEPPLTLVLLGPPAQGKSALLSLLLTTTTPVPVHPYGDASAGNTPLSVRRVEGTLRSGRPAVALEVTGCADAGSMSSATLADRFAQLHRAIEAEGGAHLGLLVRSGGRRGTQSDVLDAALLENALALPVTSLLTHAEEWEEHAASVVQSERQLGLPPPTSVSVGIVGPDARTSPKPSVVSELRARHAQSVAVVEILLRHDAAPSRVPPPPLEHGLSVLRSGHAQVASQMQFLLAAAPRAPAPAPAPTASTCVIA
jgi:hypothetical protein